MDISIIFFVALATSFITSISISKIKTYLDERQYSKFKKQFGDIIEFTYQKQDGTKTTFYKEGDSFKEKKE